MAPCCASTRYKEANPCALFATLVVDGVLLEDQGLTKAASPLHLIEVGSNYSDKRWYEHKTLEHLTTFEIT